MGYSSNSLRNHRYFYLLISFLLISTTTQVKSMVEGRAIYKLLSFAKVRDEEKLLLRARIGSRPPNCERRCNSCGHCEAVQVPVIPQDRSFGRHSAAVATISSRTDDTSNYKPMNWKCKCGDLILNP